jgi:hypothetical protein
MRHVSSKSSEILSGLVLSKISKVQTINQKADGFIFLHLPTCTQWQSYKTQNWLDEKTRRRTDLFNEWIDYVFVLQRPKGDQAHTRWVSKPITQIDNTLRPNGTASMVWQRHLDKQTQWHEKPERKRNKGYKGSEICFGILGYPQGMQPFGSRTDCGIITVRERTSTLDVETTHHHK